MIFSDDGGDGSDGPITNVCSLDNGASSKTGDSSFCEFSDLEDFLEPEFCLAIVNSDG